MSNSVLMIATAGILGEKDNPRARLWRVFWLGGLLWVAYTALAVFRLYTGRASAWDFGYYSQILWMISHGEWAARSTLNGHLALADAGSAILYPLGMIYPWLGSLGILLLQSLALASGIPFLDWWVRRVGLPEWMGWVVFGLWSCYPAILGPALFDWHPDTLAVPLAFYAIWAIETNQPRHFWLASVGLVSTKVTATLVMVGLAVPWLMKRRWVLAISATSIGLMVMIGEVDILFPRMIGHVMPQWQQNYGWLGPTPQAGLVAMITHPLAVMAQIVDKARLYYVAALVVPVGILPAFLGLGRPGWAYPAWLVMAFNGLSMFSGQVNPFNQYSVIVAPFLFVSLVVLLARIASRPPRYAVVGIMLMAFSLTLWGTFERPIIWENAPPTQALNQALAMIPPGVPVLGQNATLARLSNRQVVRLLPLPRKVTPDMRVILTKDVNPLLGPYFRRRIAHTIARLSHERGQWQTVFHRDQVWVFKPRL